MQQSCIHVYYGDGKGKTTAAMGLALRAAGCGMRVRVVQFLKGRDSGEIIALAAWPGVQVMRGKPSGKFTFQMSDAEKAEAAEAQRALFCRAAEKTEPLDLLVLDEVLDAVRVGFLEQQTVDAFLAQRPAGLEVVLTGRGPWATLLQRADYVTEMKKEKHPFDRGIAARRGIEY